MRFLRSYLSGALSDLKAGTLEKPHHLHLKRLLGWRPRDARNRVLLARHACARGLLGSQTLRVARATTARPRPRCSRGKRGRGEGRGDGRGGRRRPGLSSTLRLLLSNRRRGWRGPIGSRHQGRASEKRNAESTSRVPQSGSPLPRTSSGSPHPGSPQPPPPLGSLWDRPGSSSAAVASGQRRTFRVGAPPGWGPAGRLPG